MSKLDWDRAREHEWRQRETPPTQVLGSLQRIGPVHKHDWTDFELVVGTQSTVERTCRACGKTERGKYTRFDVAETREARARIRAQTRGRGGHALNPEGDLKLLYKQRRQNRQD